MQEYKCMKHITLTGFADCFYRMQLFIPPGDSNACACHVYSSFQKYQNKSLGDGGLNGGRGGIMKQCLILFSLTFIMYL